MKTTSHRGDDFLELFQEIDPVHSRHPDVGEDHVDARLPDPSQGLRRRGADTGDLDPEGAPVDVGDESLADELLVVDDEEPMHRRGSPR